MNDEQYQFDDLSGKVKETGKATEEQKDQKKRNYSAHLKFLTICASMGCGTFLLTSTVEGPVVHASTSPSMTEEEGPQAQEISEEMPTDLSSESSSSEVTNDSSIPDEAVSQENEESTISMISQSEEPIPSSNQSQEEEKTEEDLPIDDIYWTSTEQEVASSVPPENTSTKVWYYSGNSTPLQTVGEDVQVSTPIWSSIEFDYENVVGKVTYDSLTEMVEGVEKRPPIYRTPEEAVASSTEGILSSDSTEMLSSVLENPILIQNGTQRVVTDWEEMRHMPIEDASFPLTVSHEDGSSLTGYLNGKNVVDVLTNRMISQVSDKVGEDYGK